MPKYFKISLSVLLVVFVLSFWTYGNLRIIGEIETAKNYLGRQFGMHAVIKQDEDKKSTLSITDKNDEEVGLLRSDTIQYQLIIRPGIRIKDVDPQLIIAALVPKNPLPWWAWGSKMPPVIILHANLAVLDGNISDITPEISKCD